VTLEMTHTHKYLRASKMFPHIWCPGCGLGILLGAMIRAIHRCGYKQDDVVIVSGIGCSGRLTTYVDFNTLHTTHGRALTFATGIKLANPKLKVIVVMGDGDATAIGGNHLIHAARRNLDVTAIIANNEIYGMTGGQYSPTTPVGMPTATSPIGNIEPPLDICALVKASGGTFVARSTVYHTQLLEKMIERALQKKGFSVVEAFAHCVTYFGKHMGLTSPVKMLNWEKDNSVTVEKAGEMSEAELKGKMVIGVMVDREAPTYHEEYEKMRAAMRAKEHAV
jgi:2-oxoglutarate/2-oxoacid ferredoxin oxidoreductase subunit beta